jgi:hypothetical protein
VRTRLWVLGCLAIVLIAASYLRFLRPRLLLGRQVHNHAVCQTVVAHLDSYFDTHGSYPSDLSLLPAMQQHERSALLDGWGHEFLYTSDGERFVLVSYGRDGKPDERDYYAIGDLPTSSTSICGEFDADEVASDAGYHRLCGK